MRRKSLRLRFVPLLGALFAVLVAAGYLVAGDTPDHHALGPEIRDDYESETRDQVAALLVALGASARSEPVDRLWGDAPHA